MPPLTSYSWLASLLQHGRACWPARPGVWALTNLLAAFGVTALTMALAPRAPTASFLWPLAGVATALMTRWGASLLPGVLLAGIATAWHFATPWPAAFVTVLAGPLQALLVTRLLRRFGDPRFGRLVGFGAFAMLSLGGVAGSLLVGAAALVTLQALPSMQFWPFVATHAMADAGALLILAPLLAAWNRPLARAEAIEAAAWLALLAASPLLLKIAPADAATWLRFAPTALVLALATRLPLRETAVALVGWFILQRFVVSGAWLTQAPGDLLQQLGWSVPLAALYLNITQTERRGALRAREGSDERYRTLADSANDIVALWNVEAETLHLSPSYQRVTGHDDEATTWPQFWDRVHPRHQPLVQEAQRAVLAGEKRRVEIRYRNVRGEHPWFGLEMHLLVQEQGATRKILCTLREMTQRKELEDDLKSSKMRLHSMLAKSDVGIAIRNLKGTFAYVNPAFCEMTGFSEAELLSHPYRWLLNEDDQENSEQRAFKLVNGQNRSKRYVAERPWLRKDGSVVWVHSCVTLLDESDGSPGEILMFNVDITERKRAETALKESYQLLNAVVEGGQDAIFVKDREGRCLFANRAAAKLLGRRVQDVVGRRDDEFLAPRDAAKARANDRLLAETGAPQVVEETATLNGAERVHQSHRFPYLDEKGRVVGVIEVRRDVSDEKRREGEKRQVQKADAVSRLAGGVAHDFNNILTVILGNTSMALDAMAESDPLLQKLRLVQAAAERAAKLTRQLLAYSRKSLLRMGAVPLNDLLRGHAELAAELAGPAVRVQWELAPALWPVLADAGQLEHVLLGMVSNARDAMPAGGVLTVATANATLAEPEAASLALPPGAFVRWSIRDTGHGMDQATQVKLFEPFFTTKDPGKGTGLGLASAHGIVKQSGGAIHVTSSPGAGTTFDLYLPRCEQDGAPTEPSAEPASPDEPACILLVENEPAIRKLAQTILEQAGYRVLPATNAFEATTISLTPNLHYDLLLTDVVMPGLNGHLLAQSLQRLRAGLHVVFMSGHAPSPTDLLLAPASRAVLQKPFSRADLLAHVRAALSKPRSGA